MLSLQINMNRWHRVKSACIGCCTHSPSRNCLVRSHIVSEFSAVLLICCTCLPAMLNWAYQTMQVEVTTNKPHRRGEFFYHTHALGATSSIFRLHSGLVKHRKKMLISRGVVLWQLQLVNSPEVHKERGAAMQNAYRGSAGRLQRYGSLSEYDAGKNSESPLRDTHQFNFDSFG